MNLFVAHYLDNLRPGESYSGRHHITIVPPVEIELAELVRLIRNQKRQRLSVIAKSITRVGWNEEEMAVEYSPNKHLKDFHLGLITSIGGPEAFASLSIVAEGWQPHVTLKPGNPLPPCSLQITNLSILKTGSKEVVRTLPIT